MDETPTRPRARAAERPQRAVRSREAGGRLDRDNRLPLRSGAAKGRETATEKGARSWKAFRVPPGPCLASRDGETSRPGWAGCCAFLKPVARTEIIRSPSSRRRPVGSRVSLASRARRLKGLRRWSRRRARNAPTTSPRRFSSALQSATNCEYASVPTRPMLRDGIEVRG